MDYQGIGMLTVIVAFLAIFVYVLVSRSKAFEYETRNSK